MMLTDVLLNLMAHLDDLCPDESKEYKPMLTLSPKQYAAVHKQLSGLIINDEGLNFRFKCDENVI